MSHFERDPVSVASRQVHGPTFGAGTMALVGILGLGAGTILGGVIMPFLRSSPPDQNQTQKLKIAQETNRALLFSMYPQTIYAATIEGGVPVSTGMSIEQYLTELEVRASQAGLSTTKIVEQKGENVEISYSFASATTNNTRTFPQSKTKMAHPKTLSLTFASGPLPGTIALQKARVDGRDRGTGASFVDFVSLGAMPPQLGEGQFLTSRGIFEIKLTGSGVGAFLDGVLVYPAAAPKPGPALAFPGTKPTETPLTSALPRRLALQSFQPAIGPLKDRLILVASNSATDTCSAKAIILDSKRGTVLELPEVLNIPAVSVTNAKDALIFNGFCVREPAVASDDLAAKTPEVGTAPTVPVVPKVEIRLSARYDLNSGALTWQRETIAVPPPSAISAVGVQTGETTPWRAQGNTRLASPLISGGALVSVACRPGGGVTLALSGMPAPADGQAASMRFSSGGASSLAQMRWRASAGGYELDGASRPNEARAMLERLRAGGALTISGGGSTKIVPAPGSVQIDRLVGACGSAPAVTPAASAAASGKPKTTNSAPVRPAAPAVAKPKAPAPKSQAAPIPAKSAAKPAPKSTPNGPLAQKAPVSPRPKTPPSPPKPKVADEAAPPRKQ
jgi:hypothetical protein